MQVPDDVRKNIVFIGVKEGDRFIPKATGFLVALELEDRVFVHVVTAEHVISGLLTCGYGTIHIRVNKKGGGVIVGEADADAWYFHPDEGNRTDVAVIPFPGSHENLDCMYVHKDLLLEREDPRLQHLGVGDEVFVVGLFKSHFGAERNVPIVRIGNVAMLGSEPVFTRYAGFIEALLVETRSISGLSGSPVWVHLEPIFFKEGQLQFRRGARFLLLGLMHGHFDIQNLNEDVILEDAQGINTGIGVVIPAYKIIETLNHPDLVDWRQALLGTTREIEKLMDSMDLIQLKQHAEARLNRTTVPADRRIAKTIIEMIKRRMAREPQ